MKLQLYHLHLVALHSNLVIAFAKLSIFWGVSLNTFICVSSLFKDASLLVKAAFNFLYLHIADLLGLYVRFPVPHY